MRLAAEFYEFGEYEIATVELVTESKFEVAQVNIQGSPRWIPDSDQAHRDSLQVLGLPFIPGN